MFKGNAMGAIPDDDFEGMTAEEKDKKILDFNNWESISISCRILFIAKSAHPGKGSGF